MNGTANDNLATLGGRLRAAAPTAQPPASSKRVRFVIETEPGVTQAALAGAIATALGFESAAALAAADTSLGPLFALALEGGHMYGLERFFTLDLPLWLAGFSQAELFDLAYALRDATAARRVDPDLPDLPVIEPDPEPSPDVPRTWSLQNMNVPGAWRLSPPPGGKRQGEGVVIAHPDTGWADNIYTDSARLDLARAWNTIDDNNDARDPLFNELERLVYSGHGVGTASVFATLQGEGGRTAPPPHPPADQSVGAVLGRMLRRLLEFLENLYRGLFSRPGPEPALRAASAPLPDIPLRGVAPLATVVPIRCGETVIITQGINLAKAIYHAAHIEADVISMSVGGLPSPWLEASIHYAVFNKNCIVVAAAGQPLPIVVAPGIYPACLAAAASNIHEAPWDISGRGEAVTITAPGEEVWRAAYDRAANFNPVYRPGTGTSYSAANVAGVAALWVGFHGKANLLARYQGKRALQEVFMHLVRATAHVPPGWDTSQFGAGLVDAEALLRAPLPDPDAVPRLPDAPLPTAEVLAAYTAALHPAATPGAALAGALGVPEAAALPLAEAYEGEVLHLLLAQLETSAERPAAGVTARPAGMVQLSKRLGGAILAQHQPGGGA